MLIVSRDTPENVKIPEKQSKKANFLIIQNQLLTFANDTVHTANPLSRLQIGLSNTKKKKNRNACISD